MGSFPQKLGEWRKYSLIPRSRGMRGNGGNGAVIRGWAKNGRNGRKTAEKRPERSKTVTKRSQLHKTAGKRLKVVASAPKWPLSSCIQHLAGKKQSKNDRKRSENGRKTVQSGRNGHIDLIGLTPSCTHSPIPVLASKGIIPIPAPRGMVGEGNDPT